jgi:hypothetical protein
MRQLQTMLSLLACHPSWVRDKHVEYHALRQKITTSVHSATMMAIRYAFQQSDTGYLFHPVELWLAQRPNSFL